MFHNTSGSKLKELAYETGCFTSSSSSSSMLPYLIPEMMIIPYFTFHLCHKTHHLMISEIICVTSYMVSVSGQHKEFVMSFHYIFFLFPGEDIASLSEHQATKTLVVSPWQVEKHWKCQLLLPAERNRNLPSALPLSALSEIQGLPEYLPSATFLLISKPPPASSSSLRAS